MRRLANILAILLATLVLLIFAEGLASTAITFAKLAGRLADERVYTQYDAELGWIVRPNLHIEDMYGDGVFLKTNAQQFRNENDFQKGVPEGMARLICSGDSFTFGHGVDNDHAWCNILGRDNVRLEVANAGQVGYGIDQAFLLYRRLHSRIDHNIVIFAFVTDDFRRATLDRFLGYPKPKLTLRDGQFLVQNTPVQRRLFHSPHLITTAETLNELRSVDLLRRTFASAADIEIAVDDNAPDISRTRPIVSYILQELATISQSSGSELVLVYLPSGEWDYFAQDLETETWRAFIGEEARERGLLFFDLVEDIRKLEAASIRDLFDGHYTISGNEFVADRINKRLKSTPGIAEIIESRNAR